MNEWYAMYVCMLCYVCMVFMYFIIYVMHCMYSPTSVKDPGSCCRNARGLYIPFTCHMLLAPTESPMTFALMLLCGVMPIPGTDNRNPSLYLSIYYLTSTSIFYCIFRLDMKCEMLDGNLTTLLCYDTFLITNHLV